MDLEKEVYVADWLVEPASGHISRGERRVHLEPRVMDLLVYLAQRPGQVVSRDELFEQVWAGVVVSDESLTNAIIKLRKAFGDKARNPTVIETLSKRGYRLIAEVSEPPTPTETNVAGASGTLQAITEKPTSEDTFPPRGHEWKPSAPLVTVSLLLIVAIALVWTILDSLAPDHTEVVANSELALPEKPSIAVLPFLNTGNEAGYSYFSDGITDDLITDLSGLSGLFVISRNSTFRYKGKAADPREAARNLGVRYVLEGSVRRSGELVRVNTRLVDGATGEQIWAERYDGKLEDVFALQDQMTTKIIQALTVQLTVQEQKQLHRGDTREPAAYDEFLRGMDLRRHINRDSYARAERHFLRALEIDPEFARAHAALALLYVRIWQQGWHQNSGSHSAGFQRAKHHLERAMLRPDALTHSLRSTMQLHNRRFDEAIAEARTAVSLQTGNADSLLALAEALLYSGQSDQAIEAARRARRLDPVSPAPYLLVEGQALFDLKRYRDALRPLLEAIKANPDIYQAMIFAIACYGEIGDTEQSKHQLHRLNARLKEDRLPVFTISTLRNRFPYKDRAALEQLQAGLRNGKVPEW